MDAMDENAMVDDAVVEDEDVPFDHGEVVNRNPAILTYSFATGVSFLESYGWLLLAAGILLWYLKGFFQRKMEVWQQQKEDAEAHRTDSSDQFRQQERMLAARATLQQRYDDMAAQYNEEKRKKDEEAKKQKIEDWEAHLRGGSSKDSRERAQAMGFSGGLSGPGGGASWRPSRRQGRS